MSNKWTLEIVFRSATCPKTVILYGESWINTIIPNTKYILLCFLKNHSIIFNKIPDQIPKGYVQAKTFNGETKDKDTHTKLQYGLQAKCKSQVLVLQFIRFTIFSQEWGPRLRIPSCSSSQCRGEIWGPTPVHSAFKPQCWVYNNDVSLCAYATGSTITQKESRRVYREVLV